MKRYVPLAASLATIAGLCVTIAAFAEPDIGGPLMGRIIKTERTVAAMPAGNITGNIALARLTNATATVYQPLDSDLTDLADGTLTASKVGTGLTDAQVSDDITIASTKALSAATLSTTGTVTVALTASAGAVLASVLNNLPTGSTTNAVFIKIRVGTTIYALPAYAQAP